MSYFSISIIILSAISFYLSVYYFILWIKRALQKPYLIISTVCFFYFIYNCARVGMYNSQTRFWNYFWLYTAFTDIPIIGICIIFLIIYIFQYERISWHHDLFIIIGIYAMLAIGMLVESVVLYRESHSCILISGIDNSRVYFNRHWGSVPYMMLAFLLVSIVYIFIKFYFYYRDNKDIMKRIMLIVACLSGLSLFVVHDILVALEAIPFYLFLGEYGIFFLIIMVTYFSLNPSIYPESEVEGISGPNEALENPEYMHSLLADVNINEIHKKLDAAMLEDKMYTDPDISLRSLAKKLSISYHVLSQFLNSNIGMEFRNFINEYRVEEAKRIIASDPESSIISVCFNVGFRSKSAFNNAFKKHTGISPTEYKKNNSV
jgi:AraC-like DNA-binding protein